MSYLVLARKYRPTAFADVVGQDHVTRTLGNAFASGRVHHAFLFCGPRGVGKTTLARILGKALNCERGPTAQPCGTCPACVSISNGSAVDYLEMDGASNRGIDAIRELTESVRYQPAVLRKKVYVIDEVHMLTTEAFNALLKTLEEPPPHVTFVLATTEPHKLPNTILSRCQRYDVKLVPASRLAQHLTRIFAAEQLAIEPAAIGLIVRESGGSVRDALSLCDQLISFVGDAAITEAHVAEVLGVADRALTRGLVRAVATGDAGAALAAVDAAAERGVDEIQVARAVVRYLRDLAVSQSAPGRPELIDATDEERAELAAEASELAPTRVHQMLERMLKACDELGKTLQPRLVLDFALIDVATIEPLVPLGNLLDRLAELEARLGGGGGGTPRPRPAKPADPRPLRTSQSTAPATPSALGTATARPVASSTPTPTPTPSASSTPTPSASSTPTPSASASASAPASASASASAPASAPASASASASASAPAAAAASASASASPTASASISPSGPVPVPVTTASGSSPQPSSTPAAPPAFKRPTTAADMVVAWESVLTALEQRRKLSLFGPYQHARVMAWTPDAIELGFPAEYHNLGEMAREKASLDEMRSFLREHTGHPVNIAVRLLDATESAAAPSRSVLELDRERSADERRRRESEAREHPMTKVVLQTFGAQIKEIKTDV